MKHLFYEFKRVDMKVLIADMPRYNGERKDILIRQIMKVLAEENRRDIIERLWKGRWERVKGGSIPVEILLIVIPERENISSLT